MSHFVPLTLKPTQLSNYFFKCFLFGLFNLKKIYSLFSITLTVDGFLNSISHPFVYNIQLHGIDCIVLINKMYLCRSNVYIPVSFSTLQTFTLIETAAVCMRTCLFGFICVHIIKRGIEAQLSIAFTFESVCVHYSFDVKNVIQKQTTIR